MWKLGNIEIENKFVLAPMAGTSNPSYMKIVEDFGCSMAISELISAEAIVRGNIKTLDMLKGIDNLDMVAGIQLFGSDPKTISLAAQKIVSLYNVQFIDINMGCPVPKVVKTGSGSALLKTPDKIGEIVKAVVDAIDLPVTVKIRSGWDESSINAVEVAKIVETCGASAISIHARTRTQGYSGKADWSIIKQVKESVDIPVIGNGDVTSADAAIAMLNETGCDAVMIGRASLGNPWIFKECLMYPDKLIVSEKDKIAMIKKHYNILKQYKNEHTAMLEMRTQTLYYLKGFKNAKELKNKICTAKTEEEFFNILDECL